MDSNVELWVKINYKSSKGYTYSVSSLGNVRSDKTSRILSKCTNSNGYQVVLLGKDRPEYVHRLVCMYFNGEPQSTSHQVNHIDSDKNNNSCDNLEWVTPLGNIRHARNLGLYKKSDESMRSRFIGDRNPNSKLSTDQIIIIRKMWVEKSMKQREMALLFKVGLSTISDVCNKKYWKHLP